MKRRLFFYLIPFLLVVGACREKFSGVNLSPPPPGEQLYIDSSYQGAVPAQEPKMVLLEDFTGLDCGNCPTADNTDSVLRAQYPNEIVSICEHTVVGSLSNPLPGYPALSDSNALTLFNLFGYQGALPYGAIDRTIFPGQDTILQNYQLWGGFISTEVKVTPPLNVDVINQVYDTSSGALTATMQVTFISAVSGYCFISAAITEDSIIDPQYDIAMGGWVKNYVHQHVLRKFIYPLLGLQLGKTASYTSGNIYIIKFSTFINKAKWKPKNCNIVAFVHQETGRNLKVYQATISPLKL